MERENQRIVLTKWLLKESMLQLLKKQELEKITVTELCRNAGINRATFYRHYEIPRDVLYDMQKEMYYELRRAVRIPKNLEEIQYTIEDLCCFLEKHMDLLQVMISNNTDTDFVMFINGIYKELWQEFGQVGIFKDMDSEEIQLLAVYSAGGSYFLLRHWLLGNIHRSAKEMATYVYRLLSKQDWLTLSDQLGLLP